MAVTEVGGASLRLETNEGSRNERTLSSVARRVGSSTSAARDNFGKWRWKVREHEVAGFVAHRQSFGERFAERDAKGPDVGRGKQNGFGRGVRSSERPSGCGFAGGADAVGESFRMSPMA